MKMSVQRAGAAVGRGSWEVSCVKLSVISSGGEQDPFGLSAGTKISSKTGQEALMCAQTLPRFVLLLPRAV